MLIVFLPIFVADTKINCGCNFVAPLKIGINITFYIVLRYLYSIIIMMLERDITYSETQE